MFHLTLCLEHALWPALRALADVIQGALERVRYELAIPRTFSSKWTSTWTSLSS